MIRIGKQPTAFNDYQSMRPTIGDAKTWLRLEANPTKTQEIWQKMR